MVFPWFLKPGHLPVGFWMVFGAELISLEDHLPGSISHRKLFHESQRKWRLSPAVNHRTLGKPEENGGLMGFNGIFHGTYPLVNCYITMENHHRNSGFSHE